MASSGVLPIRSSRIETRGDDGVHRGDRLHSGLQNDDEESGQANDSLLILASARRNARGTDGQATAGLPSRAHHRNVRPNLCVHSARCLSDCRPCSTSAAGNGSMRPPRPRGHRGVIDQCPSARSATGDQGWPGDARVAALACDVVTLSTDGPLAIEGGCAFRPPAARSCGRLSAWRCADAADPEPAVLRRQSPDRWLQVDAIAAGPAGAGWLRCGTILRLPLPREQPANAAKNVPSSRVRTWPFQAKTRFESRRGRHLLTPSLARFQQPAVFASNVSSGVMPSHPVLSPGTSLWVARRRCGEQLLESGWPFKVRSP